MIRLTPREALEFHDGPVDTFVRARMAAVDCYRGVEFVDDAMAFSKWLYFGEEYWALRYHEFSAKAKPGDDALQQMQPAMFMLGVRLARRMEERVFRILLGDE